MKKSSYVLGQSVRLTKSFHRYAKNQVVEIVDPIKRGSRYTIKVKDAFGIEDSVPSKYLKALKKTNRFKS